MLSYQHPLDKPLNDDHGFEPTSVQLNQLRTHPKQAYLFGKPKDGEIEQLAQQLQQNGEARRIQILRDHTILSGYLLVKAAGRAGFETCPALIRYDLGNWEEPCSLLEFIKLTVGQKPVDEMTLGRCYRELRIALLGDRQRLSERAIFQIRNALSTDMSRASLEQLGRLAELPRFVQDLVTSKQLSRRMANRIRLLDDRVRSELVKAIAGDEPLKPLLKRFGISRNPQSRHKRPNRMASDPFSNPDHLANIKELAEFDHAIYREFHSNKSGAKPGQLPTLDDALATPALRQLSFSQDR